MRTTENDPHNLCGSSSSLVLLELLHEVLDDRPKDQSQQVK